MKDLTKGPVLKLLLIFLLPILLGNILQQFYNLGDTIIVGRTLGVNDLAAIGATTAIVDLIMSSINGFTVGFSILTGNAFGAKDEERVKGLIAREIISCLIITVVMMVSLLLGIKPILRLLKTPDDIINKSLSYVRVIIMGISITMAYNFIANTLRSLGNSVFPLISLAISSMLNLLLDVIFIRVLHTGIMGAGIATVLAQSVSVIVCLIYIIRKCPIMHIERKDFGYKNIKVNDIVMSGVGMALMYSIVAVGSIILQSGINSLGTDTIAAHVAARKILSLSMMPYGTMAASLVMFTSQNYGARKYERIKEGVIKATALGFVWGVVVMLIIRFFGVAMVKTITSNANDYIVLTAFKYLRINVNVLFFGFLAMLTFFRSTLQGLGEKVVPVIGSLTEMIGKAVFVFIFVPKYGYDAVCYCEPVLWIICAFIVMYPLYRFFSVMD